MKYCAKCGAEITENSKFCEKCGSKVNMDSESRMGKGRKQQVTVIIAIFVVVIAIAGIWRKIGRDEVIETSADIKHLPYEILEKKEIPEELLAIIEEKKESAFRLSYNDKENMYIVEGYGEQETNDYSIAINDCYLAKNAIYVDTLLIAPSKGEAVCDVKSYPYVVIKMEYLEKSVVFLSGDASSDNNVRSKDGNVKYIGGIYTSSIQLNDNAIDVAVIVNENQITSITLVNMDETTTAMYPLMQPTLDNLAQQIYEKQSLDNISYVDANQYTSMVLLNTIESALDKARYIKE